VEWRLASSQARTHTSCLACICAVRTLSAAQHPHILPVGEMNQVLDDSRRLPVLDGLLMLLLLQLLRHAPAFSCAVVVVPVMGLHGCILAQKLSPGLVPFSAHPPCREVP
jgi:hypothetical protein